MITSEDYAEWLENPVTVVVMAELRRHADRHDEAWMRAFHYPDDFDLVELNRERVRLKVRQETLRDVADLNYEEFVNWSETE